MHFDPPSMYEQTMNWWETIWGHPWCYLMWILTGMFASWLFCKQVNSMWRYDHWLFHLIIGMVPGPILLILPIGFPILKWIYGVLVGAYDWIDD